MGFSPSRLDRVHAVEHAEDLPRPERKAQNHPVETRNGGKGSSPVDLSSAGGDIPVRRGDPDWSFVVVHVLDRPEDGTAPPAVGQEVDLAVDGEYRAGLLRPAERPGAHPVRRHPCRLDGRPEVRHRHPRPVPRRVDRTDPGGSLRARPPPAPVGCPVAGVVPGAADGLVGLRAFLSACLLSRRRRRTGRRRRPRRRGSSRTRGSSASLHARTTASASWTAWSGREPPGQAVRRRRRPRRAGDGRPRRAHRCRSGAVRRPPNAPERWCRRRGCGPRGAGFRPCVPRGRG